MGDGKVIFVVVVVSRHCNCWFAEPVFARSVVHAGRDFSRDVAPNFEFKPHTCIARRVSSDDADARLQKNQVTIPSRAFSSAQILQVQVVW
jgi:hypothetical protein